MEMIFINTENSKTNEPNKSVLNFSQRLDLRSSNKHIAFQNLSVYYTCEEIQENSIKTRN